jgi:flagellar L-ring protein precursor FlgH
VQDGRHGARPHRRGRRRRRRPTASIYQAASYRPLFEDHRARLVGDTLTVQIVEKVSASQKSTSSVDKSGSAVEAGITALPGVKPARLCARRGRQFGANTFAGKGATESSNDFSGTITVVVREVLPNGHLLVAGEKQIGVNNNVDVLRFSGQVDPRAIQPGNTCPARRSPTCGSSSAAAARRPTPRASAGCRVSS